MATEAPPGWRGTGCFRIRFTLDSALLGQPLALDIGHQGASEIYLDGQLLGRYGTLGTSAATTRGYQPAYRMLPFVLRTPGPHLLAVRYAQFSNWGTYSGQAAHSGLSVWVAAQEQLLADRVETARLVTLNWIGLTGTVVLALLHFFLFLFYPKQRANLYYSLYMSCLAETALMVYLRATLMDESAREWAQIGFQVGSAVGGVLLLTFIYSVCQARVPWRWLGLLALANAGQLAWWLARPGFSNLSWLAVGIYTVIAFDLGRVLLGAMRRRQPGIWLVGLGVLCTLLVLFFAAGDVFHFWTDGLWRQLAVQVGFMMLPICTSAYLARDFAATRRALEVQLGQVEQLSAQALAQETERRQLISAQNERLEATVRARTEEISEQNLTLATQAAELAAQAEQLRALDREKTRFFTNITHEFRTPLTLMLGPAAQIAADTHEPATRQQAELVQRNAQRLLHLITQLLDLSRLEAGQQALHPAPGEVVGFVRGLVSAFESLAEQRGIACAFETSQPVLWADFDADKLEKIVVNLLSNAFKFTPSTGEVVVSLRAIEAGAAPAPTWLELTVRDTGRGIAPAHLPHVFDRFYQADSSDTREQEGTGIGLALTKELVELHGGTLVLQSELGRGTTATVCLPLALAAEAAAPFAPQPLPLTADLPANNALVTNDNPPAEAPLVLLIEDNADVRRYLRSVLAPSYQVLEAADGEAGVALAQEHLPDLVLTDAMMPRLDGYGVCRALKQDARTSHIPVVMLTARADRPSKLQGLDLGADAYLTKPFHRDELLAQLRNLVRGRQQLQEAYRRSLASPPPPGPPTIEQVFLANVQQAVEQALDDETLDVETLSRTLALSRTQLHRKLKALTGQAPGDFIRSVRLNRAHALLVGGGATVAEVAYQVGYGNPANFSTSFARHFGYPPSEARRRPLA